MLGCLPLLGLLVQLLDILFNDIGPEVPFEVWKLCDTGNTIFYAVFEDILWAEVTEEIENKTRTPANITTAKWSQC